MKLRALIVGYGSIGRRHAETLRSCGVHEYVVVGGASRPLVERRAMSVVSSLEQGIAARPDLAVIASPSAAHFEALVPLLEAGVACYVEKPAVTKAAHIEHLRRLLASRPSVVTSSGCNLRFLPALQRMRETLRSGAVGTPVRASLQAGQWLPDWRPQRDYRTTYSAKRCEGGGVILDLIHEIDSARWLFGEFDEVLALSAKLSRLEIDAEDTACILLGRRGGPIVTVSLDYVSRRHVRRYDIVGDEGTLSCDLGAKELALTTAAGTEVLERDAASFDVGATYRDALHEFVTAVRSGGHTSQDLLDGLATAELALRAKR